MGDTVNRRPNREVSPHVTLDELIARELGKLALPPIDDSDPGTLLDPEFDDEGDYHAYPR